MRTLVTIVLVLAASSAALAGGGPENVLVVVNDADPESVDVAQYYILRRGIPRHHLVHVRIEGGGFEKHGHYDGYKQLLEDPVRAWLDAHPDAHITTIALARGIPVVASGKGADNAPRSVAHMLALVGLPEEHPMREARKGLMGPQSPIHRTDQSIDPREPAKADLPLYCVSVLNAKTVEDVKLMIDRSIESDAKRPEGTIYLGLSKQGDPRGMYSGNFPPLKDTWEKELGFKSVIVDHDDSGMLLKDRKDVLLYQFGQANWDEKFPALNAYRPGALVDNITSVALTRDKFRADTKGGQTAMTHFLSAGATVVHGCVAEPTTGAWDPGYLHLTRYLQGYNVIESFYMGHPWFPWMNLVAGDPLTQPFAQRPEAKLESFEKSDGGYLLKVTAKATREGAGIRRIVCYVDGVKSGEADGAEGAFMLKDFRPEMHSWSVVAIDDSKFAAQGRLDSEPLKKEVGRLKVDLKSWSRGRAVIKLTADKKAIYTFVAPGSKTPVGADNDSELRLEYAAAKEGHVVELWLKNAKDGVPAYHRVELPAAK